MKGIWGKFENINNKRIMGEIFTDKPDTPKVFISYSYDTLEHTAWVESLANKLRKDAGIDAMIDKFALNRASDLDEIMINGFEQSDKVVIIATSEYATKSNSIKSGVNFETTLATIIARRGNKEKLIFVKKDSTSDFDSIFPFQFKDYYAIDFSKESDFSDKFKELYYKIWGKDYHVMEEIGKSPFATEEISSIDNESVFNIFKTAGFEPYNLDKSNLINKSTIIWPVVPRQQINLIHKSQIEVVRVLFLLGWDLKIIIANCGSHTQPTPSKDDVEFKVKLEKCLKDKDINSYEITFLNKYFSKDFLDGNNILNKFIQISSSLKISELSTFNTKNGTYDESAQKEINGRTTLKYISPLLTWAASIFEAEKSLETNNNSKPIIVAGRDEESQWAHVFSTINSNIGAVFIPILQQENQITEYQEKLKVIFSQKQLEDRLGNGNIDKWLVQSFVYLSEFPKPIQDIPSCKNINSASCNQHKTCFECLFPNDSDKFPDFIDKRKFAETIFPKINPA